MKLHVQLWLVFSLLFLVVCAVLYWVISDAYEDRVLQGREQLSIAEGLSVVERVRETHPRFPERTRGYVQAYSDRFDTRILIIDYQYAIVFDSEQILPAGRTLALPILDTDIMSLPRSVFIQTSSFGYVQHTLLTLQEGNLDQGYLLMIQDVNVIYDDIRSFQNWMLLLLGATIILFFFLCYWISNWFTAPIARIIKRMEQMTPQNRNFQFAYRRNDEMKQLVQAIESMVGQLNEYDRRQRQFLSVSSHELKTPLATMQLIAENLEHTREDEATYAEFVGDLQLQLDKMKQMVQQLLQMNRYWEIELEFAPLSSADWQEHIQENFQHMAEHRGVRLRYDFDELSFHVDHELFFRGMDNILSNAIRYSPEDTDLLVELRKQSASSIQIRVQDQGIGISPKDLPYLYDPFYRSNEATEWNQEGSGLGLTLVKQMVDLHKGEIKIDSVSAQGTTVTVTLPSHM